MKTLRVGHQLIGTDKPVMVIAEIGVNHDGQVGRALDLVRFAHRGGADAVKLQLFRADKLMHASTQLAAYQAENVTENSAIEILRKFELSIDDTKRVVDLIRSSAMTPIATPFSIDDIATIEALEIPAIKIASPDIVNRPLLEAAAKTKLPMLVSTGAANVEEIESAVRWLNEASAKFALLHCISSYPTTNEDANLCWIGELAAKFDVPIGYSDHTTDVNAGAFAAMASACVVEKHLTYDRNATGPDHAASANPADFKRYVEAIRAAEVMRGKSGKQVLDCERDVRKLSRQSVVAVRDIKPGDKIEPDDLIVQRPGTGVPAAEFARIVGRKSRRSIAAGTVLQWDMLADAA